MSAKLSTTEAPKELWEAWVIVKVFEKGVALMSSKYKCKVCNMYTVQAMTIN